MSEELFILCQDDFGNYEIRYDEEVFHFLWEVAPILNEQQAIIHRDEISIKTMMSNMKKLEEENEELKEIHQKGSKSCEKWKQHKEAQIQQLEKENTNLIELAEKLGVKIEVVDDE